MFNLRRYFSLASAAAIVAVTVTLVVVYHRHSIDNLIEAAESENVTLARAFENTIWPQISAYVMSASRADGGALRERSETQEIHDVLMTLTSGLAVLRVTIYDLQGLTVYSSQPSQIGADKSNNLGYLKSARHGTPASKLSHRDTFSAFSGTVQDRDLVESYIPIWGPDGTIEGVFELYTDVTPRIARLKRGTIRLTVGLLLILGVLYRALFLIVQHADRILKKQYRDLLRSEESIKDRNSALEIEITERTQAENALRAAHDTLRESEERFSKAFQSNPSLMVIAGVDDGMIYDVNNSWCSTMGYPRDEAIGKKGFEIGIWVDASHRTSLVAALKKEGSVRDFEIPFRTMDGEVRDFLVAVERIELDGGPRLLIVSHDITERKRVEEALRESDTRLKDAIESISEGFIIFDADERFVLCNSRYRDFYPSAVNFLKPGSKLEELALGVFLAGDVKGAEENIEELTEQRLIQFRTGKGTHEQQLKDGRW